MTNINDLVDRVKKALNNYCWVVDGVVPGYGSEYTEANEALDELARIVKPKDNWHEIWSGKVCEVTMRVLMCGPMDFRVESWDTGGWSEQSHSQWMEIHALRYALNAWYTKCQEMSK